MSVGFAKAVAEGLAFNNVPVTWEPGWETRGNGFTFPNGQPQGLITHHTGSDYGTGLSVLVNGRSDLDPPLCNCCTYPDGTIHIIAAHCANHAGASGGPSMGPLPVTSLFNPVVWGNEVMFPGTKPWTTAQYRSARVLAGVISGILNRPTPEWVRGHYETSITGKWDPGLGQGSGSSFPMNVFRAEVWSALTHSATGFREDTMRDYYISGKGRIPIIIPTGDAALNKRRAWLSALVVNLAGTAWIQVYAQGVGRGLNDWRWTEKDLTPNAQNLAPRPWKELLSGTSHLIVSWDLTNAPEGGVLTMETVV